MEVHWFLGQSPRPGSLQGLQRAPCWDATLLTVASLKLTALRPSASCSCPGAWYILLRVTSGSEVLSFIDPKSGIPCHLPGGA